MTMEHRHISEERVPGKALGRHVEHDPLSRGFRAPVDGIAPQTRVWRRHAVPFDQGDLGSCTGNAIVGCAATDPTWQRGKRYGETVAVKVYELATTLDSFPLAYPPHDTGSTGLAACKAAVRLGLATRYLWGFGIADMIAILSALGPVAVGTDWHAGMDTPDAAGIVHATGPVRGGHEYQVLGYHHDQTMGAPRGEMFECQNSWGASWGVKGNGKGGRFFITVTDMAGLLDAGGDVVTLTTDHKPGG